MAPGVTASATGLAHAQLDRSPLLYISDRHPGAVLAYATHQYVDHAAHLGPIVKGSVTVTPESAGHWVAHAVQLALAEPRGPVHLDLPADVAGAPAVPVATAVTRPPPPAPDDALVERAAEMIRGAKRPLVIAGLGCRAADAKWLRAFSEALPAPVLTTYKAKGAIPDPHPLAMGIFTGGALEEPLVRRGRPDHHLRPRHGGADPAALVLHRAGAEPRARPSSDPRLRAPGGGAYFTPALEVVGDLGTILEDLAPRIMRRDVKADWDVAEVDRIRRERAAALEVPVPGLAPHRVAQIARELTAAGSIATVDAGAHMFQTTTYWHSLEPGELLISNGLATMGFALPAAIAAQLVHPGPACDLLHRRRRPHDGGLRARDGGAPAPADRDRGLQRRGAVADRGEAGAEGLRGCLHALRGARSPRARARLRHPGAGAPPTRRRCTAR